MAGVAVRQDSGDTCHDAHCLADKLWLQRQLRIQVEEVELERRQRTIPDSGLVHNRCFYCLGMAARTLYDSI